MKNWLQNVFDKNEDNHEEIHKIFCEDSAHFSFDYNDYESCISCTSERKNRWIEYYNDYCYAEKIGNYQYPLEMYDDSDSYEISDIKQERRDYYTKIKTKGKLLDKKRHLKNKGLINLKN